MEFLTKIKTDSFLYKIRIILEDKDYTFIERIEDAKTLCRETKGALSFVTYEVLDIVYKEVK